jgi:tetratricopeptide (TPR) repeat protein
MTPAGRARDVATFDRLLSADSNEWVWLVDGLTGVGKTYLVDWLRKHRCAGVVTTLVPLGPRIGLDTVLARIADQVGGEVRRSFRASMDAIRAEERRQALVHNAPVMVVDASGESAIGSARQSAGVAIDGDALVTMAMRDRRQQRADAFVDAFDTPPDRLVLLFDDADALDGDLAATLFAEIVPRLRDRVRDLRVVVAGQTVPTELFDPGQRLTSRLDVLDDDAAGELLRARGIADQEVARKLIETSGGLPWLLVQGTELAPAESMRLAAEGNPTERTRRIFERVVHQLRDPGARLIAADISLLDWFDVGILRAVFGESVGASAVDELVRRSFVKPLPDGGYVCHGVIRPLLREQRWRDDASRCRQIARDAHMAYRTRLVDEERARDSFAVPDRLGLAAAALAVVRTADRQLMRSWCRLELGLSLANLHLEHAFEWIRMLDGEEDSELRSLGADGRRCGAALALLRLDATEAAILADLATTCEAEQRVDAAVSLTCTASAAFRASGKMERAIQLAKDAYARHPEPALAIRWSVAVGGTGDLDGARSVLVDALAQLGPLDELRLAEAQLMARRGELDAALTLYRELAEVNGPSQQTARLCLAGLAAATDPSQALAQVDAVLAVEPGNREALVLRARLLEQLGRNDEVIDLVIRNPALSIQAVSELAELQRAFHDKAARRRIVAEIELRPERVTRGGAVVLAEVLALFGEVNALDKLAAFACGRWPDLGPIFAIGRANALVGAGRAAEAVELLAPIVRSGPTLPGTYLALSSALQATGRLREVRPVLEKFALDCPAWAGEAWGQILAVTLGTDGIGAAIAVADALPSTVLAAPQVRFMHARIRLEAGDAAAAERLLDAFVLTEGSESANTGLLVMARQLRAQALVVLGRTTEARAIATDLAVDFGAEEAAIVGSAELLMMLGDERGVRDLVVATTDDRVAIRVLDGAIELILRRQSDPLALLAELERDGSRFELVAAIGVASVREGRNDIGVLSDRALGLLTPKARSRWERLQATFQSSSSPAQVSALRELIVVRPDDPALRVSLVAALKSVGDYEAALAEVDVAEARFPTIPAAGMRIDIWITAGRLDEAGAALAPYLELANPPAEQAGYVLAYHMARKDFESATRVMRSLADAHPSERTSMLVGSADMLLGAGKPEEALSLVENLTTSGSDQLANLLTTRAHALLELERHGEVPDVLAPALALSDLSPDWRARLLRREGDAMRKLGRTDDAIIRYRIAADLSTRAVSARLALAELLEAKGDNEGAFERLMEVISFDPTRRAELLPRMERLRTSES